MKNEHNKGYNVSMITLGICVVLALTYLIPQTLKEHQMEEERMERLLSIEEDWQRYVPLPNLYDMEIRSIMQTFAEKAPQEARAALEETLRGTSARLRFRRAVQSLSLAAAWQAHLSSSLLALARDWCEENAIAYRE